MAITKTLKQGPVAASGPLVLLLLATAAMTLQRTGAATSSAFCTAETAACNDNEECVGCMSGYYSVDGGPEAFVECLEDTSYYYDAADPCTSLAGTPCCSDLMSANDCLGNSAFVDFWVCYMNEFTDALGVSGECTAASLTCDGSGAEVVVDDTDDADATDDGTGGVIGDDAPVLADDDDAGTDDGTGGAIGDNPAGSADVDDDVANADREVVVSDDDAPAAAADDDAGSASEYSCTEESLACLGDAECSECLTWGTTDSAQEAFGECMDTQNYDAETDVCTLLSLTPCCVEAVSSNNCEDNSAYVELWTCIVRDQEGCTAITCDGGTTFGDGAAASGAAAASSPSSGALAAFLGLAFFVAAAPFMAVSL